MFIEFDITLLSQIYNFSKLKQLLINGLILSDNNHLKNETAKIIFELF